MEYLYRYKKYILLSIAIIILFTFTFIYYQNSNLVEEETIEETPITTTKKVETKTIGFVDIKGAVKNPGVISFEEGERVIDAIEKAGGLTKNGTTSNINLSQKLKNEMVIYIFTKSELTTKKSTSKTTSTTSTTTTAACQCETIEINNCIEEEPQTDSNLININTATIEELSTLPGIGQAKAKAIITYRTDNGNFTTIEDIKKVSGLGDALFEKIKEYITV